MAGPANQSVLGPATRVQWKAAEGPLRDVSGSNTGPVLQPERRGKARELLVERGWSFARIDRAGGLPHNGAAIQITGVAKQGGAGF
jgi:hypothetical protein